MEHSTMPREAHPNQRQVHSLEVSGTLAALKDGLLQIADVRIVAHDQEGAPCQICVNPSDTGEACAGSARRQFFRIHEADWEACELIRVIRHTSQLITYPSSSRTPVPPSCISLTSSTSLRVHPLNSLMTNGSGGPFCDRNLTRRIVFHDLANELSKQDYVTGEMWKNAQ